MMNRRQLRSSKQVNPGEKAFEALDVNKDGVVTVDEVVKGTDLTKDNVGAFLQRQYFLEK